MGRKKILIVSGVEPGKVLSGKDILQISISKFVEVCPDIRVIVILPPGKIAFWQQYCTISNFNCPQTLIPAAFTPFHSVRKALEKIPDGAIVAIHDGARPLVSHALIGRIFERMEAGARAVVPVIPAPGSVMQEGEDGLAPGLGAAIAQTPQLFRVEDLRQAYAQAYDTRFTDPASIVAGIKIPLTPVEGERYNIRIDTPEDLVAAGALSRALTAGNK